MTYGYHPTKEHLGGYVEGGDPMTFAPEIWSKLAAIYAPANMVDIGCGEGHAARWFETERRIVATGIDGCAPKNDLVPEGRRILHDYETGPLPPKLFPRVGWDLAWCCEFVEHVAPECVWNILDTMRFARVIAMTHAVPGQAGHHHVNCQPADYWIAKLANVGKRVNLPLSRLLRDETKAHWVRQTLLVFESDAP